MKTFMPVMATLLLMGASVPALAAGRDIGSTEREGMAIVVRYIQAVEVESADPAQATASQAAPSKPASSMPGMAMPGMAMPGMNHANMPGMGNAPAPTPAPAPAPAGGGMAGHMGHGGPADAHLEVLITATKDNGYGFYPGAFVPYLQVEYVVRKQDSNWVGDGVLQPMIASDGPHYATNLLLNGPGKYTVELIVGPPSPKVFPRHIDKETGVKPWWSPISMEWGFTFIGTTGKKGGY